MNASRADSSRVFHFSSSAFLMSKPLSSGFCAFTAARLLTMKLLRGPEGFFGISFRYLNLASVTFFRRCACLYFLKYAPPSSLPLKAFSSSTYFFMSSSASSVYFFFASSSSFWNSADISAVGIWPFFSLANNLNASGGFVGKSIGFSGKGTFFMPFLSVLRTIFFWLRRLCTGSFKRLASVTYSFHSSLAMYSFTTSCHCLYFSFFWPSYSPLVTLSSFTHSSLYFVSSSRLTFLLLLWPDASSSAARFSCRKTAKPVLGGCAGALFRNLMVITFMASFMNSVLIFSLVFRKPLNLSDSFHSVISFAHCSFSSFSFSASWAFSSSEASANFFFRAWAPLPSPLPGSTSFLCSSAYMAKTDFGRLGMSIMFTCLFSLALVLKRSSRKAV
mmetsp:Transcript_17268/g.45746  ORF Transcript_17268/g.45746 Transcript_17268/m.45746 type:complete len:389 (-) Transcript_17268:1119-2285(-)